MVKFDEEKQKRQIEELRRDEEEKLAEVLSRKYGLDYIDLTRLSINNDALRVIPEAEARGAKLAPFDIIGRKLKIAVLAPKNEKTVALIEELTKKGYTSTLFMVSGKSLERAWGRYEELKEGTETEAGILEISNEEIGQAMEKVKSIEDVRAIIEETLSQKGTYRISRILETILGAALTLEASDVHIEPEEGYIRLRYRLDGVLTDILTFKKETFGLLLSRLKLLSGLKLNLKKSGQDGRFSIKVKNTEIEIRTSVLPGAYDESVVMRILNPKTIAVPMEELGVPLSLYPLLEREIRKPTGMILNTGPTGSGKTTTLYAFLKKIHSPDIKIITIEDPIEYHIEGVVQTQVDHKNYTFAEGLRSAVRQDPDVIMVGEIRDNETAETAVNAGLTGHLVLSTLHTNNAAGAFPRLVDLGVNSSVMGSAINIVMAQRLLRKLCKECRKEKELEGEEKTFVENVIANLPEKSKGVTLSKVFEAAGCPSCHNSGYRGRIGIFEAIRMTEAVEAAVRQNSSQREIVKASKDQGLLSLIEDGVLKVLQGVTTLSELGRVIDLGLSVKEGEKWKDTAGNRV